MAWGSECYFYGVINSIFFASQVFSCILIPSTTNHFRQSFKIVDCDFGKNLRHILIYLIFFPSSRLTILNANGKC